MKEESRRKATERAVAEKAAAASKAAVEKAAAAAKAAAEKAAAEKAAAEKAAAEKAAAEKAAAEKAAEKAATEKAAAEKAAAEKAAAKAAAEKAAEKAAAEKAAAVTARQAEALARAEAAREKTVLANAAAEKAAAEKAAAEKAAAETIHPTASVPPPIALHAPQLIEATNAFSEAAIIGRGAYGVVFCVPLLPAVAHAGAVAVKRLFDESEQGLMHLQREVAILRTCRHENLLPLVGFCFEARSRCLVSPLCRGGSLEDRLLPSELGRQRLGMLGYVQPPPPLSWRERLRILRDAARGLVYLHMPSADGSKPVVLHRDVKPQNILLTEQLGVRLADFGLAKQHEAYMAADDARPPLSTMCAIKGTPGFLDPLATNSAGHVSEVNDGFAMGITILVALTGLPATDIQPRCRQLLCNPGRPDKWVAPGRPDATAGEWPDAVATGLAAVVVGLAMEQFKEDRLPLPEALAELEALAQSFGVDEAASRAPLLAEERAARQPLAECLICLDAPREMRLGCGHAICCERCLPQLSECPTCRQTIIRGEAKRLGGAMLSTAAAASAIATFEMVVPNAAHRAQAFGAMRAAAEQTRRDEVEHVAAPISLSGRGGRGGRGTGRGRARVG